MLDMEGLIKTMRVNRTSQYKYFSNVIIFLQKIGNVKVSIYIAVM